MKSVKVEGTLKIDKWEKPLKFKGVVSTQGRPSSMMRRKGAKVKPV